MVAPAPATPSMPRDRICTIRMRRPLDLCLAFHSRVRKKTSRAVAHGKLFQSVIRRFNAWGALACSLLSQPATTALATPLLVREE